MEFDRKVISILLITSMILASVAIVSENVSSIDVGGKTVTDIASLPNGVTINDISWMDDGSMALAVGANESGGSNAFWYYPNTDQWVAITPYCVEVVMELVHTQTATETGPYALADSPVYNYTFYVDDGSLSQIVEGVDYTFDPVTGHITMLAGIAPAADILCWYNYSVRELFATEYDKFTGSFGIVGSFIDGIQSSALYITPGSSEMMEISHNGAWPTQELRGMDVDEYGNFLAVGSNDLVLFYRLLDDTWYAVADNEGETGWDYNDVSYELENHRYYLVGGNASGGVIAYCDALADNTAIPVKHHNYDSFANMTQKAIINSIEWNNDPNKFGGNQYALLVGGSDLVMIQPIDSGSPMIVGPQIPNMVFEDVGFDEYSWADATLVGWDQSTSKGYILYFTPGESNIKTLHSDLSQKFYCVDYRPPNSPSFGFVLGATGAMKINTNAFDMTTKLYVNTDVPHVFDIDMWDASDAGQVSVLNTQVDVKNTYTFFTEVNYTIGGVDEFWDNNDNVRVILWAWHDEGQTDTDSNPEGTWATEDNRTRQFSVAWDEGTTLVPGQGSASMLYPVGSAGEDEFRLDSYWVDPTGYGLDSSTWRLYFNITFDNQTWAADGNGFGNGASSNINDPGQSLNDINSWDMRFQIYDQNFVTALNESYEEFGIFKFTNISVSGNPMGNAPPGTNDSALSPFSQITYAANLDYYLNVSITNLSKVGGGAEIGANNIRVEMNDPQANSTNTQLNDTFSYFPDADIPLGIWGNVSQPVSNWVLPAPLNGTTANGPFGSDYNAYGGATDLEWYATVPGATLEGIYEAVITITIGYY